MELNTPKTVTLEARADLPDYLAYLAGPGQDAFISATMKPGGFLNPGYIEAMERLETKERVAIMSLRPELTPAERSAKIAAIKRKTGAGAAEAIYDECVVKWETNIQNGGEAMVCDRENFLAMAQLRIPEIRDWFKALHDFATDAARYVAEDDGETEKN